VALVGGQPIPLLAGMTVQARQSIRLLAVDPGAPATRALVGPYAQTAIRRESYPDWLEQDVPTLAVGTLLMTREYRTPAIRAQLEGLAHAICRGADRLRAQGHPKWKEVEFGAPALPAQWRYYQPSQEALAHCLAQSHGDAGL